MSDLKACDSCHLINLGEKALDDRNELRECTDCDCLLCDLIIMAQDGRLEPFAPILHALPSAKTEYVNGTYRCINHGWLIQPTPDKPCPTCGGSGFDRVPLGEPTTEDICPTCHGSGKADSTLDDEVEDTLTGGGE